MRNIYRSPFEVIETRINNLVCCVISGIFDTCCCETAISDFWCSRCQIELPVCIEINGSKRTFRNFLNQTGCIQNLYVHHCIVCGSFYGNFSIYRECPACCLGIYLCKLIAVPCHIKQCICSVCIILHAFDNFINTIHILCHASVQFSIASKVLLNCIIQSIRTFCIAVDTVCKCSGSVCKCVRSTY